MKPKQLLIIECNLKDIKNFIEEHHYSKNVNGVKAELCFKVMFENSLVGAVLFGQMSTTAWKKFSNSESEVLELRRLVLLNECERNSESYVIGYCLRYIKKNRKCIKTVVSYADPNHGHIGTIYKASNFVFVGMSSADYAFRDIISNKTYHSRALRTKYKGEYKPFVKILRDKLINNQLVKVKLLPKYCYVYRIK